jgi:ribonuclease D
MTIRVHEGDLPDLSAYGDSVAVDTEAMGLRPHRDRLCVVQLSPGNGDVDVVRISAGQTSAPNLARLFTNPAVLKIFHYARFDVALLRHALGIAVSPIWCTKIASKLVRTYTDRHGLKDLTRELIGVEMSKAAAILRLGRGKALRGADRICGFRCASPPRAEGYARSAATSRGPA